MGEKKRAKLSAYWMTPFMALVTTLVVSLGATYGLNLRGANSPVPVFVFFAIIHLLTMTLYGVLPDRAKNIPRYFSMIIIGSCLLFLAGILGKQNFQVEGLFFFLMAGAFGGVVVHFIVGKIFGPIINGRNWCSWGCWTVMILDLLPYKESKGWVKNRSHFKYIYFILALLIVAILTYGFNYSIYDPASTGTVKAMYWFIIGNIIYYLVGIILAIKLKDNRAFCKYLCPASVFLKFSAIFSLLRIKGDKDKCTECGKCVKKCPMDIDIPAYLKVTPRIKSTECVLCMKCIATCPEAVLKSSVGFDLAGKNFIKKVD